MSKRYPLWAATMLVAAASLARTSTPPIEASEVAQALQQGGIPFAGPIASGGPIEGSLSSASTTTDGATVAVLVFDSNGARYDARQKEVDGCPSCSYAAQCGALLVSFTPKQMPDDAAAARARTAYQILKSRYACE